MIVSHSLRCVYIGPPKTGSTTMHKWLVQPILFDPAQDMDTSATGHQHAHVIPADAAGYYVFMTVRDRDAWLDSLWRQSRNDAVDYDDDDGDHPLLTWDQFLVWRKTCADRFYTWELEQYRPERVDLCLDCDNLSTDILKLPFYSAMRSRLDQLIHHNYNKRSPKGLSHD